MITREDIRYIPRLHKLIERDKEQLLYLREKATSIPSLEIHERVQTSPSNQSNKYVDAAVDLAKEIADKEDELAELQMKASEFIETVDDDLTRKVLRMRYIKCYTWETTGELLGYVPRWIMRLEAEAIKDL